MNDQEFWDGLERLQQHVKNGNSVGSFIKEKQPIMPTERRHKIVQFLAKKPGATMREISEGTDIIMRSVHREIVALGREGIVEINKMRRICEGRVNCISLTGKYKRSMSTTPH